MNTPRIALLAAAGTLALGASLAVAHQAGTPPTIAFPTSDADARACNGMYPNLTVSYKMKQKGSSHRPRSKVRLKLRRGAPQTIYTVWVRTTEASPLTGKTVTPLIPTRRFASFVPATPDSDLVDEIFRPGSGDEGQGKNLRGNIFRTDSRGNADFEVKVDYWLFGGTLPFGKVAHGLPSLPIQDSTTADDDRTLTIVSHCGGGAHGLVPSTAEDPHQSWFHVSMAGPKVKGKATKMLKRR
ncbi:MAG: hypothetical protein OEM67_09035 [Thermoleophilia bacterium]|nr:hypothetical protein [Thermoleophilia bacterium]MDH3724265.1 hypothetical protein [Thermoleophilia bacterium]